MHVEERAAVVVPHHKWCRFYNHLGHHLNLSLYHSLPVDMQWSVGLVDVIEENWKLFRFSRSYQNKVIGDERYVIFLYSFTEISLSKLMLKNSLPKLWSMLPRYAQTCKIQIWTEHLNPGCQHKLYAKARNVRMYRQDVQTSKYSWASALVTNRTIKAFIDIIIIAWTLIPRILKDNIIFHSITNTIRIKLTSKITMLSCHHVCSFRKSLYSFSAHFIGTRFWYF